MQRESRSKLTFIQLGSQSLSLTVLTDKPAKSQNKPKGAAVEHERHYMHYSYYNKHKSIQRGEHKHCLKPRLIKPGKNDDWKLASLCQLLVFFAQQTNNGATQCLCFLGFRGFLGFLGAPDALFVCCFFPEIMHVTRTADPVASMKAASPSRRSWPAR